MPRFENPRSAFRSWLLNPRVIWQQTSDTRQVTIEIQQGLPLLLVVFLLGWYIAAPSAVVIMSLVTLLGIVACDVAWAFSMARRVTGKRQLRFTAMQVGDELEEEIFLINQSILPVLWAEFVDHSNIPGYTVSSVRGADGSSRVEWRAHTLCTRRGIFNLGPWELRLGQPFGLLLVRQIYLQRQEILVYPPMAMLPEQIMPYRGQMGDQRPLNQPLRAETIAANSVRSYEPGDPLRKVHWPTTARRAELFVKDFSPEAASNVWLVPDFYSPDHSQPAAEPARAGAGDASTEELMVTVVASLAAALLQARLTVGMFACPDEDRVVLPRQGQAHLWPILQALAPLRAGPAHPLEDTLARAGALITGRDLLVVVTPSLRPDWVLPLQRLSRSRSGSGRAEVILLDPQSMAHWPGETLLALLQERGVRTHRLGQSDIRVISGYYGELSRWEFTVSATGKAVLRNAPRSADPQGAGGRLITRLGRGQ